MLRLTGKTGSLSFLMEALAAVPFGSGRRNEFDRKKGEL